ncbi:MAG TPA: hypothetical protein VHV80_01275 [Steroidobacteraceae bacterium]|jgi:hypothetical protein|nr:hypothetical protein [Steroidobacteraceae bacterium]
MKTSRVIALFTSVAVNLLIVGLLVFWVVPAADIARLPAVGAVARMLAFA